MPPIENWSTADTVPLHRGGSPLLSYETLSQQGARSTGDMLKGTVIAQNGGTRAWKQVTPASVVGEQLPRAILMRTILEQDLIDGIVLNVPIVRGGSPPVVYDRTRLILEDSVTFEELINNPAGLASTVRELLVWANIYIIGTQDIEKFTPAGS